jgi:hypothetical protein
VRDPGGPELSSARLAALREQVARERGVLERRAALHPGAAERVQARARSYATRRELQRARPELRPVPASRLWLLWTLFALIAGLLVALPAMLVKELAGYSNDDPVFLVGLGLTVLFVGWLVYLWLGSLHRRHLLDPPLPPLGDEADQPSRDKAA